MSLRSPAYNASPRKVIILVRRNQAQRKLQKAVARGLIKKPSHCQRCRKPFPKPRLQGHHHRGYSNPLDVKWYCQACHYKQHSLRFQSNAAYRQMLRLDGLIGH
jgi:hypothetical protein